MHAKIVRCAINRLLDLVFPSRGYERFIDEISSATFLARAKPPRPPPPGGIIALFPYRDPIVRQAIRVLKYRGSRKAATLFAPAVADLVTALSSESALWDGNAPTILVPIPLSAARREERGWNQTELVATVVKKYISDKLCVVRTDILEKIRHTAPQTTLKRKARLKNLKGCFAVAKPECVRGKTIILLDDVVTTGSTISEAAMTLHTENPKRVIGIALSH